MSLLCYPLFLLYKLLNMFHVCQWTHYLLTGSDSLPAATAKYQHVAITLRSRQLLKMGTRLPETCWATCKGEIKDNTKVTSSWFLIHTEFTMHGQPHIKFILVMMTASIASCLKSPLG